MEDQKQRPPGSDEIDLGQFFQWIGRGFRNLGHSLIAGMAGLRNQFHDNRLYFTGIIVLGIILGVIYSKLLKRDYYKSSMILSCDYLSAQMLENTIQKLNLLAAEADKDNLRESLNLDAETAQNIQRFNYVSFVSDDEVVKMAVLKEQLNNAAPEKKDLVEALMDQLEIQNRNAYEISAYVYDPAIVKPLEKALVDYFNSNSYISRRVEINRKNLEDRKLKLEKELQKLDSLKLVLFQNYQSFARKNSGSNNVVVGGEDGMMDPLEVFTKDLELHEELQKVNAKLYLTPDFEIVEGFTSFKEPEGASLADVLAISLLLSILIGYLILGVYRFDRMLASYPRKK